MADKTHAMFGSVPGVYTPAQPYSGNKSFMEPRQRSIPPPNMVYPEKPPVVGQRWASFEHGSFEYGNPIFLQSLVASGDLRFSDTMLEWTYEMRRTAQPILPFLLLGSVSTARDAAFVRDSGITFLIAVRSGSAVRARPQFLDPSTFTSGAGLQHLTVDLDTPYDLRKNLRHTIKLMNDHLERSSGPMPLAKLEDIRGKILVFCESGNERSTALVAAYLMVVYGVDMVTAIQIIQSRRFCISPDNSMKEMLLDLEVYLQAERQVATANALQEQSAARQSFHPISLNRATKRNIDRTYESDDEMDDADHDFAGEYDGNGRSGIAPFADVVD